MTHAPYEHSIQDRPDLTLNVSPPFHFAMDAAGNPIPTHPEYVGSAPVIWTAYIFSTVDRREEMRQTMVFLTGEHGYPPPPVVTEARIQLFGAETK